MQLQTIIFFLQKFVDKEALDEDGITPFIRYFDDKNIPNYNEGFGKYIIILKIYKKNYGNEQLWRCFRRKHEKA